MIKSIRLLAFCFCVPMCAQTGAQAADMPDSTAAMNAYEQQQYQHCADILTGLQREGIALIRESVLLRAECLSAAGDVDEAIRHLDIELVHGQIDTDDLRNKDHPGLNAIRQSSQWPALLARAEQVDAGRDQALRQELLRRAQEDQAARNAFIGDGLSVQAWEQVKPVDRDNTAWLKQLITEIGWPGTSLVGVDGANAAWLLVQHADADPKFQEQVLPLMEAAVDNREAFPDRFAMLTDRVLRAQNKRQRYGTQFQISNGVMTMQPVRDKANLDARRRKMGLPPIAEYEKMLSEIYQQAAK
jgi:hypothetical protein